MRLPRLIEIGLVAGILPVALLVVERPWIDVFFVWVLLSSLFLLGRYVLAAVVLSRRARRHEREVAAVEPRAVAEAAVREERARLSAEIDRSVRRSLLEVRRLCGEATALLSSGADPRPALVAMQHESRAAMTELRRQLGLIGVQCPAEAVGMPDVHGSDAVRTPRGPQISRADLVLTVALLTLTAAEALVFRVPGSSWPMTAAMALTVLTRRLIPIPSALAATIILLLGVVLDAAVADGFSFPIIVGLLLWSVLVRGVGMASVATSVALSGAAVGSRFAHDPENGPISVVLLGIVSVAAVVVGRSRRSRARSDARTTAHHVELEAVRGAATDSLRRTMARELHDVVSHAVGLVAVQAGAAELAWPSDPTATRAGLRAVQETVATALTELDAQSGDDGPAATWDDIERTVERLRAAGLDVRLTATAQPPRALLPVVHRVVQEALTNVLKHAGGATAYVMVGCDGGDGEPGRTTVEVSDDGPGRVTAVSGYGLVGLEDRVATVGGTLQVGPVTGGGFAVRAVLPHDPAVVETESVR